MGRKANHPSNFNQSEVTLTISRDKVEEWPPCSTFKVGNGASLVMATGDDGGSFFALEEFGESPNLRSPPPLFLSFFFFFFFSSLFLSGD